MVMVADGEEEEESKREAHDNQEEDKDILEEKTPAEWRNNNSLKRLK